MKVFHLGNAILEVAADRLELSDGLLGISILAVAINLKNKAGIEELQFPKEEVSRLFGGVACMWQCFVEKKFVLKFWY